MQDFKNFITKQIRDKMYHSMYNSIKLERKLYLFCIKYYELVKQNFYYDFQLKIESIYIG